MGGSYVFGCSSCISFNPISPLNLFMHNVVKWPNIILKYCGVNTERFLKYVWPFYNIMHERVNVKILRAYN